MSGMLQKIAGRIRIILCIGRIHSVDDDDRAQATYLEGETQDKNRIVQHYGFSSKPPPGSLCVGVCSGSRSGAIILGTDHTESKPSLKPGETCLFSNEGSEVKLAKGGQIYIKAKEISIRNNNTNDDLVKLVVDLVEAVETTMVPTMMGPQALSSRAQLAALKERMRRFCNA